MVLSAFLRMVSGDFDFAALASDLKMTPILKLFDLDYQ